jgi:hypothetical protein
MFPRSMPIIQKLTAFVQCRTLISNQHKCDTRYQPSTINPLRRRNRQPHQNLQLILHRNPPIPPRQHRIPHRILPLIPPTLLALDRKSAIPRIRRGGRIWPDGLHRGVFLGAGEEVRHIGEEPVYFVRGMDHDLGVRHGEGDFYLPPVAGRGY